MTIMRRTQEVQGNMKVKLAAVLFMIACTAMVIGLVMATGKDAPKSPPSVAQSQQMQAADKFDKPSQPVSPDGPHPVIEFTETVHDFGTQMIGAELKNTFTFKNKGDATLVIDKVKSG